MAAGQAPYTRHLDPFDASVLTLPPRRGRRDGGRRRGRVHLFPMGRGGATRTWTRPPRSSKTTGGSPGRMRRRDRSGECTKLGLRPSNSPRHGTNVTMISRAAHGRFEHAAASQHRRLRKARGRKGKAGRVDVTCENARATRTTPHLPEREGETVCVKRVQWAKSSLYGQATAGKAFVKGAHRLADPQSRSFRHASP